MKSRLLLIGMVVLLMLGAVYIVGTTMYEERQALPSSNVFTESTSSLPIDAGVFARSNQALSYTNMPEGNRSLATYYDNRAYPGAPPSIPHPLISEKGIGGKTCLQCHQNGGFVSQFEAFAPVTPHPEWVNCKQCHLPKKTNELFKGTNWKKIAPPKLHQVAMEGAPPVIPHTLEMRSNCLACHAGVAAPKEIRVSHPERVNCQQCHLPKTTPDTFTKPESKGAVFQRSDELIGEHSPTLNESELSEIGAWADQNKH